MEAAGGARPASEVEGEHEREVEREVERDVTLRISRRAGTEDVPLPRYMTAGASGLDVCAAVDADLPIAAGAVALVPTGLCLEVPAGYEVQVRARSGLALKHGISLANGVGSIDSDFRGELGVILVNFGREPFVVRRGMRIAQLVVARVERARVAVVEALTETARGAGGFGHTGQAG